MKRKRLPLIAASLAALVLIGVFWLYTGPDLQPDSIIPDEEPPLGSPAQAYDSGYGITWNHALVGDSTVFIGTYEGNPSARLIVAGNTDPNETVRPGMNRQDAEAVLGPPLSMYNRTRISALNGPGKSFYQSGNDLMILYFDTMNTQQVVFVVQITGDIAANTRFFTSPDLDPFSVEDTEAMALDLMNAVRVAYGKAPLSNDSQLTAVARAHSRSMVEENYFSHDSPDGQTMKTRLNAAGLTYRNSGEALCAGTWTPMDAIMAWMNSPAHRSILLGDYSSAGIGVAAGDSAYGIYYTLNVIKN